MLETTLQLNDTDERCGFLLKDGTIVPIDNVAFEPHLGYEMNSQQALPYVQAGTIAATWHTHPDGPPILSGEDYEAFLAWPDFEHYVIGRSKGKVVVTKYKIERGLVIVA